MKRILILSSNGRLGGVETSLANLLKYLSAKDCAVDLGLWDQDGPLLDHLPRNVTLLDLGAKDSRLYRAPSWRSPNRARHGVLDKAKSLLGALLIRAEKVLGKPYKSMSRLPGAYDIAIAYKHRGFGPYYVIDHVEAEKKLMWFHHGVYEPSSWGARNERKYFRAMDHVVAVSAACESMLLESIPDLQNTTVVSNLVGAARVRELASLPPGDEVQWDTQPTLVTVSRLSSEKGIDIAVSAASLLQAQGFDFRWVIVGSGPQEEMLLAQVESLGLRDIVLFVGPKENPYPYMQRADIYVQPSRIEAEGLAIREAMALGRPIVASNLPAVSRLLGDGKLGVICEPDPTSLAAAILPLLRSEPARDRLTQTLSAEPQDDVESASRLDQLLGLD